MVPAFFVRLEALPLTPNGKLDRKALPEPERGRRQTQGEGERRALTPVEEVLVGIWSEVLGVAEVGLADNFFEMGGHSLLATQVVSRVNRAFQVEMPVRRVFESPSVAALARSVESAVRENRQSMLPPMLRVERERETLPLSFAQQRLWFLDQLEPESAAYNLPAAIRLTGQLDLPALERTLNEIIRRHEILRTTFVQADGDVVQVIHPAQTLKMPLVDLCGLDESEREAELQGLVAEISRQPFDLSEWPLLRVKLIRLGAEEHVVLLVMHHIVTDGWSLDVFVKETVVLYEAFRRELPSPLAELAVQYADYAHWQQQWLRGEILEAHLSYWQKALADAPPVLHLPTDRPRHGWRSTQGAATPFRLSASLSNRLRELSRQEDATLFMLLLAAFQVLLRSYTGQDNILVGTSIANRQQRELEELIGFFVNTLALNTDLSGNPSFRELLARVREVTLGAYDHQDLPFEKIQEEFQTRGHAGRLNIQVFFALLNAPLSALELAGLAVTRLDIDTVNSKFELGLYVVESAEGIGGRLEYSTELYDAGTVARFLEDYRTLLEAVGENPEIDLASLSGLIEEDALLLDDFNADLEAM
jgi:acyl carrier protein